MAVGQILNTLRRRWRLISYVLLGGAVVALLAAIFFPPLYMGTAQLILDLQVPESVNVNGNGVGIIPFSEAGQEAAVDTHITGLTSDGNLRDALRSLGVLRDTGTQEADEASRAAENTALIRLRRGLNVHQERRSRIISVGYLDRNPARAAQVANAVAMVYLESLRREKRNRAEQALRRFDRHVADVRQEVAQAENDVHVFRQSHTADSNATGPDQMEHRIAQVARQLALLGSDAAAGKKKLQDLSNLRRSGGTTSDIAKALDSPRLQELANAAARKLRGGGGADPSPLALLQAIDAEIAASTARLEMAQDTYASQMKSVDSTLDVLRRAAAQGNDDTVALQGLERKASALGQVYESLLRQRQDLFERTKEAEPDIRIVASAEPPIHPSSLNRLYLIPPAFIVLLLLGCMLALILDRLDRTLRGERETVEALRVPCAGLLPRLTARDLKSIPQLLAEAPGAPYSKAIRHIFAGTVPLFRSDPDHKVVLITSSVPHEEKTNLAWSLAISAAQLRWNVLVLEAGPQSSSLRAQALKSVEPRACGVPLAEVMAQQRPLTSAITSIGRSSIDLLSLGTETNLLHAIADPAFPDVLLQVRDAYNLVIVDAPSIFDSSEVRLLVSKVDKVLFAVRWGATPRETAAHAIEMIEASDQNGSDSPDKIVSILTGVDIEEHARYRFRDQGDLLSRPRP